MYLKIFRYGIIGIFPGLVDYLGTVQHMHYCFSVSAQWQVCQGHYVFRLHASKPASMHVCVCLACVLFAQCLTNQWTEFHQALVDDVVEVTDEFVRFWRSSVQGHNEVIHLSELFWQTETHIDAWTLKCCLVCYQLFDLLLHLPAIFFIGRGVVGNIFSYTPITESKRAILYHF